MNMEVCRFCLHEDATATNPFFAPCRCTGSVRYVHVECMRTWLQTTTNPDFRIRCQICSHAYHFPCKHPLETIPDITGTFFSYLLTPIVPSVGLFYAYLFVLAFFEDHVTNTGTQPSTFHVYYKRFGYDVCVFSLVSVYLWYYNKYARLVRNKALHSNYTHYQRYFFATFMVLLVAGMYGTRFLLSKELFGMLLVSLMPHYYTVHVRALRRINQEGQLI
jgi:hypothetical protein